METFTMSHCHLVLLFFSLANSDLFCVVCQIAEKEAAKGSTGSGKLRKDALSALRTLLLKVQFCVQILLSASS